MPTFFHHCPSAKEVFWGKLDSVRKGKGNSDDLCLCPCHLEGLECHSCYVVNCQTIRLQAEIKRLVSSG
jgi:hypothetical protein